MCQSLLNIPATIVSGHASSQSQSFAATPNEDAVEDVSGGFHIFEIHAPSAGVSVFALMAFAAALIAIRLCCRMIPTCCCHPPQYTPEPEVFYRPSAPRFNVAPMGLTTTAADFIPPSPTTSRSSLRSSPLGEENQNHSYVDQHLNILKNEDRVKEEPLYPVTPAMVP